MRSSVNAEIRSLGEAVASDFDAQATTGSNSNHHPHPHSNSPPPHLPSPITLYRTGRILYTACQTNHVHVARSFDSMIANLPRNYVHDVLLHSLHISYASLIVSFASTSSSSTSLQSPNISTLRKMLGKSNYIECTTSSWKDILEGTQSLCGIYMASVNACQCCSCYDCGLTNNGHTFPSDNDI